MQIRIFKDTETVRYAAEELAKYLGIMDNTIGTEIVVSQEISKDAFPFLTSQASHLATSLL